MAVVAALVVGTLATGPGAQPAAATPAPADKWTRQLGTAEIDVARGLATDAEGNVYVTGTTSATMPGAAESYAGGEDAFVAAWTSAGRLRWVRQLGTPGNDEGNGITVDAAGNVTVTGTTIGTIPGASTPNAGDTDAFVASFTSGGQTRWIRQFGTANSESANAITSDASGNVTITGSTFGVVPGVATPNAGDADVLVASWTSSGQLRWARQLGTSGTDEGEAATTDAAGNVTIAGTTGGTLPGSPDANAGGDDAFVASWTAAGAPRWVRQAGSAAADTAHGVAVDAAGNVTVTGATYGTLANSPDANAGDSDIFVVSYSSFGQNRWVHQLGTSTYDDATAIAVDPGGNTVVTGTTFATLPGTHDRQFGGGDAVFASWGTTGDVRWVRQIGTSDYDSATGVAIDPSGGQHIAGITYSTLRGSADNTAGLSDVFVTTGTPPDPCAYAEACSFKFGGAGDVAVPADFNGDSRADFAIFRPSAGTWYIDTNRDGNADRQIAFGGPGDRAYAADYDGDGVADLIIFRGSIGTWFVDTNRDGNADRQISYASPGDLPYIGDFNSDGRIDLGIFRPSEGNWYVDTNGDGIGDIVEHYASPGDIPAPADYDRNGTIDYAIFRPTNGCFYINDRHFHSGFTPAPWGGSLPNGFATTVVGFASPGDLMAPADYAGTGTTQLAIFRPSTGTWWIRNAEWNVPRGDEATACR